jgi:hypothetical protein
MVRLGWAVEGGRQQRVSAHRGKNGRARSVVHILPFSLGGGTTRRTPTTPTTHNRPPKKQLRLLRDVREDA